MKDKINKFLSNNVYSMVSFTLSFIAVLIIYMLKGVIPFGDKTILTVDFYHQYGPMLGELFDRIKNNTNLVYSFNMGMGLPFFRNFFNYLSSPVNILMLLFTKNTLLSSYSMIIACKVGLSACFMNSFLEYKHQKKTPYFIVLSILYALCAYFVAYYWNIMWTDSLYLLPLVAKGIDKIVRENKPILYIVSLVTMLFANYFMGYVLCIFSVLYFISQIIIDNKNIFKKILIFTISSLTAVLLSMWFLLPMYDAVVSISATSDSFPTSQYYAFTIKDFLINHLSGVDSTVFKTDIASAPNISVGILTSFLAVIYLLNRKINLKEKIVYMSFLVFLFLSFYIGPLDFIWHAMHVPIDLPFRYSYIYSFILILMASNILINYDKINKKIFYIIYLFFIIILAYLYLYDIRIISKDMILLNGIVLTIYVVLYFLHTKFKKCRKFIPIIAILVSLAEVILVINSNWHIILTASGFNSNNAIMAETLEEINKENKSMYRIDSINLHTYNDSSWYNYYGQKTFSSMAYEDMAKLMRYLGLPSNATTCYSYKQTTPIYDLLFNIQYFIGINNDEINYQSVHNKKYVIVNKLNYNTNLFYVVNRNVKEWKLNNNPFENLNNYALKSTNVKDVMEKAIINKKEKIYGQDGYTIMKYTVKSRQNSNLYLYNNSDFIDYMVVDNTLYYKNGKFNDIPEEYKNIYTNSIRYNEPYIVNLKTSNEEIEVYVGYNSVHENDLYMYNLNQNQYEEFYNKLTKSKIKTNQFKENNITITTNTKDSKTVYTSIPYDKGWQVYIDGKKVNTYKIGNALLGFDITKGKHKIELKYKIPYFKTGICISTITLIMLIIYIKRANKRK